MRITLDYVMSLDPCYSKKLIQLKFGKRKYVKPLTVLNSDFPSEDKIWFFMKADILTRTQKRTFIERCIKHIAHYKNNAAFYATRCMYDVSQPLTLINVTNAAAHAKKNINAIRQEKEWQVEQLKGVLNEKINTSLDAA